MFSPLEIVQNLPEDVSERLNHYLTAVENDLRKVNAIEGISLFLEDDSVRDNTALSTMFVLLSKSINTFLLFLFKSQHASISGEIMWGYYIRVSGEIHIYWK